MGYLYLLMFAVFCSFAGTCVKLIRPFFSPGMITFMRFFVGVLWLLGLKALKRQRFRADLGEALRSHWKWILVGAAAKFLAYTTENIALSVGVSYGNILTQPVQLVLLTVLGATVLRERMDKGRWTGITMCVLGIFMISWNGLPLSSLLGQNLKLTLLYILSGVCAGMFVFAQKMVADHFDILDSNLIMFSVAALMGFIVPLGQGTVFPSTVPNLSCLAAILWFGFVTGVGFYLNAKAIPLVPFRMVALLQSTMVFFSLAWGILFFQEKVSVWIIIGTISFVFGVFLMQYGPGNRRKQDVMPD